MNYPPVTTTNPVRMEFVCLACGKTKQNATLWYDHKRGIVHCGCAHTTT